MSFQIYPGASDKPEMCWRCKTLDPDAFPMHPGQQFISVAVGNEVKGRCCLPCWDAISEYVKVNPSMISLDREEKS